jgi:opacity protein-like surface antigen
MRNATKLGVLAAATTALCTISARDAHASFIDVGVQAGVEGRHLADVAYKPGFNLQLHADLALIPPILMVGGYLNGVPVGGKLVPDQANNESKNSINFQGGGLRAKLKIPLPGPVTPYGIAGIGLVHGDFPEQNVQVCRSINGSSVCASQKVTAATALFAEFVLGAGVMIEIGGPLYLTLEGSWRPSTGYKNDTYEQQIQSQSTTAPSPSRNGYAWTAHGGLAFSF